jgi:hypothetical protein
MGVVASAVRAFTSAGERRHCTCLARFHAPLTAKPGCGNGESDSPTATTVHRDLKPSNLFLPSGDMERAVLIDFGIARDGARWNTSPHSGRIIGTPQYMAPEQARSERDITAATDVFSLGCVLFECLSGAPPFSADNLPAVLAKILFENPRRIEGLRPEVPGHLGALLDRMLNKMPDKRPVDALALLAALDQQAGHQPSAPGAALTAAHLDGDQGLVSVLVATLRQSASELETLDSRAGEAQRQQLRRLEAALLSIGTRVELIGDDYLIAVFVPSRGTATELVAQAARAALLLQKEWPGARISLATGRGSLSEAAPTGEAAERAAQALIDDADFEPMAAAIRIDRNTAALLSPGFRVLRTAGGQVLDGITQEADPPRLLCGRFAPFVGREAEMAMLEGALTSCIHDSQPVAVLVLAEPGIGKSRLRYEMVQQVTRREEPITVLIGCGNSFLSQSAYGLLGQALRQLCGLLEEEPLQVQRERLRQRVTRRMSAETAALALAPLGEICGIPFGEERSAAAEIQTALLAFFRAECASQPVLLVLEDLHWADPMTMRLIDSVVADLGDVPLMILATAWPELRDQFPALGAGFLQWLRLRPLSKKASTQLLLKSLGASRPAAVLNRIVEQSAGNGLYLEELARAEVEGHGDAPPRSVLEPATRCVLRAASIFGTTFWIGGVRVLLADAQDGKLAARLEALMKAELIEPCPDSRLPGEREFRFVHPLMRLAVLELLSEAQRSVYQERCLEFLERSSVSVPTVFGEPPPPAR